MICQVGLLMQLKNKSINTNIHFGVGMEFKPKTLLKITCIVLKVYTIFVLTKRERNEKNTII